MRQFRNLIFDVTIHAFDTSSAVRLRSSPNLPPDRIFVLPFPVTLTTLTLNQRSSRWFGNYFWKSSPEGPPPSFPQLRAKTSCSRGTPEPYVNLSIHTALPIQSISYHKTIASVRTNQVDFGLHPVTNSLHAVGVHESAYTSEPPTRQVCDLNDAISDSVLIDKTLRNTLSNHVSQH